MGAKPAQKKKRVVSPESLANLRKGKGKSKGKATAGQKLDHMLFIYYRTGNIRATAAATGWAPSWICELLQRDYVKERQEELRKMYVAARIQQLAEKDGEAAILQEEAVDEQVLDMTINGEQKQGRLRACTLAYRKMRLIDPPSPQTLVALAMMQQRAGVGTAGNAPKLYQAQRFLKMQQGALEGQVQTPPKSNA